MMTGWSYGPEYSSLTGPSFEGQYMLGSVNFVRMADSGTSLAPGCTLSSPGMAIGKLGPCQS